MATRFRMERPLRRCNGGFAGAIDYAGLANAVANGYAAFGFRYGTQGQLRRRSLGAWASGKVADFGYRAVHETAEKAKALIAALYGSPAHKSYFSSCSDGGREALMEAQRFPADYDVILAGAPANDWTDLLANAAEETQILADPAKYVPAAKLPAIHAATLWAHAMRRMV